MFTLDAKFRSERCSFNDQKNKIRNQKRDRRLYSNCKKNEKKM